MRSIGMGAIMSTPGPTFTSSGTRDLSRIEWSIPFMPSIPAMPEWSIMPISTMLSVGISRSAGGVARWPLWLVRLATPMPLRSIASATIAWLPSGGLTITS